MSQEILPTGAPSTPSQEKEKRFQNRHEAFAYLIKRGLNLVHDRYDPGGNEEYLPFHGSNHTKEVVENIEKILTALNALPDDIEFGKAAAAWHDSIMGVLVDAAGIRIRLRGFYTEEATNSDNPLLDTGELGNERASAEEIILAMKECFNVNGDPMFNDQDYARIRRIIAGTFVNVKMEKYPDEETERMKEIEDFGQMPGDKKNPNIGLHIYQPHVLKNIESKNIDKVEMALALADFGVYGMQDDPEIVFRAGNAEFREINMASDQPIALEGLTRKERKSFGRKMLDWVATQVGFLRFRRVDVHRFANTLGPEDRDILLELFKHQDNIIIAAINRSKRMRDTYWNSVVENGDKEAFLALAREMGYDVDTRYDSN